MRLSLLFLGAVATALTLGACGSGNANPDTEVEEVEGVVVQSVILPDDTITATSPCNDTTCITSECQRADKGTDKCVDKGSGKCPDKCADKSVDKRNDKMNDKPSAKESNETAQKAPQHEGGSKESNTN